MSVVNEALVRDIVAEVLSRLSNGSGPARGTVPSSTQPCGCNGSGNGSARSSNVRGKFGVFQTANEACQAAQDAFVQLQEKGVEARRKAKSGLPGRAMRKGHVNG